MKTISLSALALLLTGVICPAQDRIQVGGFNCYYGVLHAHSVLSPDFSPALSRTDLIAAVSLSNPDRLQLANGPLQAWTRAADAAKLDFLALTEHVHGPEQGNLEPCDHEMPADGYSLLLEAAEKMNNDPARQGKFLAIPGMEWSSISSGNHINLLFARNYVKSSIRNGDFLGLLDGYIRNPQFEGGNADLLVQLNHPNDGDLDRSYGRRAFPATVAGEQQFVQTFGDVYFAIEHINNSNHSNENTSEVNEHRDGDGLSFHYRSYLNMGLRLAPVGDHDNHRANWGRHTAARTGVWARELTKAGFVEAYKARRMFATEDNELAVAFRCGEKWMGDSATVPANGALREFTVNIDQIADTDAATKQDEGPYIVELFGDEDGVGGAIAERVSVTTSSGAESASVRVETGGEIKLQRQVKPGSYYFIHVRETQGQDSGGSQDDAWTAPIFFKAE